MAKPNHLLESVPGDLPDEFIETLLTARDARIERIVSRGHSSPEGFWYDQDTHEWVLLVAGAAWLRFEDGHVLDMTPGSYMNIRAHCRYRVEWTDPSQPTVWLAIHYSLAVAGQAAQ